MNIKSVLRVYSQLRNLTDDETALLETLRAMTDAERELAAETLQPQKVAKKASKKAASKSPRASGIATAIKGNLDQRRAASEPTNDPSLTGPVCAKEGCDWKAEDLIHDPKGGYAGYHEFQPSDATAAHGAGGD